MNWSRTETLALANHSCLQCSGLGLHTDQLGQPAEPCKCVLRNVFRACYARFQECSLKEKFLSKTSLSVGQGHSHKGSWDRKDENFIADFYLVSRRSLCDFEFQLFKYHFLLGADWRLCCRKLQVDRGAFYHSVYRIEQRLGRVFRELEPFPLYPLDEYFHGEIGVVHPTQLNEARVIPIRPISRKQRPQVLPERKTA